jgi:uncharacterized membrane protein YecN with MAPEG domain
MIIYPLTLLFTVLSVVSLQENTSFYRKSGPVYAWQYFFCWVLMFLVFGLRYEVGTDYAGYVRMFETLGMTVHTQEWEPLFYGIGWLGMRMFDSGPVTLSVIFGASFALVIYTISKHSPHAWLSVLLFFGANFSFLYCNQVRQCLAISICFASVILIIRNKPIAFVCLMAAAVCIHKSSLLFAPAFFVRYIPFSKKALVIILVLSLVGAGALMPDVTGMVNTASEAVYEGGYTSSLEKSSEADRDIGMGLRYLFMNIVCLTCILVAPKKMSISAQCVIILFVIGQVMFNMFIGVYALARMSYYYSIFVVLAVPYTLSMVADLRVRIFTIAGFSLCFSALFLRAISTNSHNVVPYRSLLQDKK